VLLQQSILEKRAEDVSRRIQARKVVGVGVIRYGPYFRKKLRQNLVLKDGRNYFSEKGGRY
jgi:hypothetical protein